MGLPFASFPSMTYYQREMFDEAGLNYPPDAYGKPYVMPGGKEVEWNYDTLTNLAKVLTVDTDGNSPLEIDENDEFVPNPDFDATQIVQYGYVPQYQDPRAIGSFWSPAASWRTTARPRRFRTPGPRPGSGTTTACGATSPSSPPSRSSSRLSSAPATRTTAARSPWP